MHCFDCLWACLTFESVSLTVEKVPAWIPVLLSQQGPELTLKHGAAVGEKFHHATLRAHLTQSQLNKPNKWRERWERIILVPPELCLCSVIYQFITITLHCSVKKARLHSLCLPLLGIRNLRKNRILDDEDKEHRGEMI